MRLSLGLAAAASLCFASLTAHADSTYSYQGTAFGTSAITVTFDSSLNASQLADLTPGTDITSSLLSFTMAYAAPSLDDAGFPVGESYFESGEDVKIGTNADGKITSWDVSDVLFASYPAAPGEDPTALYCTYTVSTTTSGDSSSLKTDNDVGFCPASASTSVAGKWTGGTAPTPEPSSIALLGSGLFGVGVSMRRRFRSSK